MAQRRKGRQAMKLEQIPDYVVEMNLSSFCDMDKCPYPAEYYYRNSVDDPDAFQVWSLCEDHAAEFDALQERRSEETPPTAEDQAQHDFMMGL